MSAARMALVALVPKVYAEWQNSSGRIVALNKQNRNGVEVVEQEKASLTFVKEAQQQIVSPRANIIHPDQ
jgi:hypothetical protein